MKFTERMNCYANQNVVALRQELAEDPRLTAYIQRQEQQHIELSAYVPWREILSSLSMGPGNSAAFAHNILLRATGLDKWLRAQAQKQLQNVPLQ